jgi:hypothetical protein
MWILWSRRYRNFIKEFWNCKTEVSGQRSEVRKRRERSETGKIEEIGYADSVCERFDCLPKGIPPGYVYF